MIHRRVAIFVGVVSVACVALTGWTSAAPAAGLLASFILGAMIGCAYRRSRGGRAKASPAGLDQALKLLRRSRDEIGRQHRRIEALASADPLTGCTNRRAFFDALQAQWSSAKRYGHPLACLMVDVDAFRQINDRHGHAAGDQVLQHVGQKLKSLSRESDLVCRYGGDEFIVLLPQIDLDRAAQAADRFRLGIESASCAGVVVTVSIGCAALAPDMASPQAMLDRADAAVRAARQLGLNSAARWDEICETDTEASQVLPARSTPDGSSDSAAPSDAASAVDRAMPIPFHAATALMSALAHRDAATAEHSQRVADLCVATARGLMSVNDCFVLEVAAMLHDIGKLGVPDAILLKPDALTEDEWKVMRTHDLMGVEIISAAFGSAALTDIVRNHHAPFAGACDDPSLPRGRDIPLGARILTIADAYDAMVSTRPYHRPKTRDQAFAELRRCAGRQFDPELVARLISAVECCDKLRSAPGLSVSGRAALRIRLEIERLACAMEEHDLSLLTAMAGRIASVAQAEGLGEVAEVAASIQSQATQEADLDGILKLTNELLTLCRSPQVLDPNTHARKGLTNFARPGTPNR